MTPLSERNPLPDSGAGSRQRPGDESGSGFASFFRRGKKEHLEPAPGLAVGKVVGDFRLVALIGQGGMGQIWEAEQLSLGGRRVAMKFVRPERVTERQLELFAREARAGGRLHHPGIVTMFGHGTSEGLAWIAMEFVEGACTLKDFLDEVSRSGDVPGDYDRHVARLVAEIAEAMQVAHEVRVIHRDVKPQNVLITAEDRPKVTDFGLARITDETAISMTGELAGTFAYMSPEQVAASRMGIDHRTDVFSLGVVLYELLALQRPFQGDNEHQVAAQIVMRDPPDPRTFRSRVPRDLVVIAGKALEKDRDKRFRTMADFAADLRRFLGHEAILARPPTRLNRALKWVKRNPAKSTAAAIAGVAFAAISLLLVETLRARDELSLSIQALSEKSHESELRREQAEQNEQRALAGEKLAAEERERADLVAQEKTRMLDQLTQLADSQRLDDLVVQADRLWPAHPENLEEYDEWLRAADDLHERLPDHEAKLAELRAKAMPWSEVRPAGQSSSGSPLESEIVPGGEWRFADAKDKWWHNQLEKLVSGIAELWHPETGLATAGFSAGHGWGVARRAEFALGIAERSVSGAEAAARWAEAIPSIADEYAGLRIAPQLGLLPIGRDPFSGFWEFAHLQTGEPAERAADGRLTLTEETGLVLVLLPGGRYLMGAQREDPSAPHHDPEAGAEDGPVREETLPPFFLSKYEMTQGQWLRLTGVNPSLYAPETYNRIWNARGLDGSLQHPVEQVTWIECTTVLGRMGLELPSEVQWEYAARGGTATVWWCGDERESIASAGNVADRHAKEHGGDAWQMWEDWDDGNTCHARVGSFDPNDFGLHDTIGNVCEMCRDLFAAGLPDRVARGGSFGFAATSARSADRAPNAPEDLDVNLGVRPARRIAP